MISLESLKDFKMPPALLKLQAWFDGMEAPRRNLILIMILLVLLFSWLNLLWQPYQKRQQLYQVTTTELNKSVSELVNRLQKMPLAKKVDLNAERQARIQALEQELRELATTVGKESGTLIQPAEMLKALRQLLSERPAVKVRRLEAANVQPVQLSTTATIKQAVQGTATSLNKKAAAGSSAKKTEDPAVPMIYRHDIELEIEAGYLDVLAFCKEVESYPWVFFWDEVRYHAVNYPLTHAVIRFFTLSIGEGLIGG
ncbi:MAG: hypothetical protein HQM06_00405 [Magnetococcales bacterium]|nr:hypothetical protein [Magnetococcales bacterium]